MRNLKVYLSDVVRRPPILFPLVGLFHLLWFVRTIWSLRGSPFGLEWLQVLWMAGYTFFWLGVCDLRKWGAFGYMALTSLNIILFFSLKTVYEKDVYTSSLFLIDALFSFFILVFFRRFQNREQ